MQIRPMTIEDYDEVFAMWQITSARALSSADSRENIEKYLRRNEGMSQVALVDGRIVGTVLAGHDGRRGFIHHMAVHPDYRRHHIGRQLALEAGGRITADGIEKVHIFSYVDNTTGQDFWKSLGFKKRDFFVFSK
jgi:ribosomal protein S18 acetylase RimI-like enzyme